MAAVGGDITEIRYNHPTLGTGVFYPKSGEDNTYDPGGIRTGSDANMIDGSGNPIFQKNRVRGFFEAVIANDQNTAQEAETMAALSASPVPAEWSFSIINGTTYSGTGTVVGDIQPNINQATVTLRVEGGQFRKTSG